MLLLLATALAEPDPERMLRPDWHSAGGGILSSTAHVGFQIWRHGITPGDGPRCPMRPSCSAYSMQAFQRDGLGGYVLTFDRLLRDSDTSGYPLAPDGLHVHDPLANHPPPGQLLLGLHCARQRGDGAQLCL